MSDLDGLGVDRALELKCLHCSKVVNIAASRERLLMQLVHHLSDDHDIDVGVILENKDFVIAPASLRCDLCMTPTEPPFWTYVTPNAPVQDPGWLVCDLCHPILQDRRGRKLERLIERSFSQQKSTMVFGPLSDDEARGAIRRSISTFLTFKRGAPTRGTA